MFLTALHSTQSNSQEAEMQKIKYDKVRQLDKIVFLALGLILVALVIQMAILNWINNRNISKMSEVLLDRVVNVIEKNEQDEKDMIASLKRTILCVPRQWPILSMRIRKQIKNPERFMERQILLISGKKLDDIGITKKGVMRKVKYSLVSMKSMVKIIAVLFISQEIMRWELPAPILPMRKVMPLRADRRDLSYAGSSGNYLYVCKG